MKKTSVVLMFCLFIVMGCGPKQFTKGEYGDASNVDLLDDKWNEADMQQVAAKLVDSLIKDLSSIQSYISKKEKPIVQVERVANRTSEHVDTKSLTDKIRVALIKSRKFMFTDKEARETLAEEYEYQDSGYVNQKSQKKKGSQIGADYIINGDITSNVQQVGDKKIIYYKITMNLTNVSTNIIEWTDESELKKYFKKRSVGL